MSALLTARLNRSRATIAIAPALAILALLPGLAYAAKPSPPMVPPRIQVPAGNVPFILGHATGTQNYVCQASATGFAWTFVAPAATLVDDKGKVIITHFAGPTWAAKDGSTVKGARVDGVSMSASAIDWLLLRATATTLGQDGGDRLKSTTFIQRVNTTGGLAPTTGCDAAHAGETRNVPYTSDYYFYRAAGVD